MKHKAILSLFLATTAFISSKAYADQNFVLCVSPQFSKGITLEYDSNNSGCVVDDHTNDNFSAANKTLIRGYNKADATFADINTSVVNTAQEGDSKAVDDPFKTHGHGPIISDGFAFIPYTVVFESAHKVLGFEKIGNCNIHSERSERVEIKVLKDGKKISTIYCYHPDNLSNTYCQQTENSDSFGIAFSEAVSEPWCTFDEDTSDTVGVLIYPTN